MVIHVTLTQEIFFEFSYYTGWKAPWNRRKRIIYYLKVILYTFIIAIFFYLATTMKFSSEPAIISLLFLLIYFAVIVPIWIKNRYNNLAQKFFQNPQNANVFLPTSIEITARGIKNKDSISETNYSWSAFVKKAIHKKIIYLYLNNQQAILIPESSFENKLQKKEFEGLLAEYLPLQAEFIDYIK